MDGEQSHKPKGQAGGKVEKQSAVPLLKLSGSGKPAASLEVKSSPRRSGGFSSSPLSSPGGVQTPTSNSGISTPPTPPPPPPAMIAESPRLRTNTHKFATDFEKLQVLSDRRRSCAPNTLKPLKPS